MSSSALQLDERVPPGPMDPGEADRWNHTRMRRRLLYSEHRAELERRLEKHIGPVRKQAWGPVDCSANPYLSLWETAARLYSEAPALTGNPELLDALDRAGLWSLMQRQQRDTLGLREMGLRVDIIDGQPVFSPVFADLLEGSPDPKNPGQLLRAVETRWTDGIGWTRCVYDVTGVPSYRAIALDGSDVSADVLGGTFVGDGYPFRVDGLPVVPIVIYHAAETSRLWDAFAGAEIVEGSWMLGIFRTYFGHVVRNCAWSQRYAVGVDVGGADVMTGEGSGGARREVTTDPATVTMFNAAEDGGQPLIGQWAPPILPDTLIGAIARYEEMLVESAGLRLDVTRQSSDIRSGYSLAVARESLREAQRVYEPLFRRSDLMLMRLTAGLMGLDPGDLSIAYRGLPESPVERSARVAEVLQLRQAGLISLQAAYERLNPDLSPDQIAADLAQIGASAQGSA
jgi:hypothetical protein